MRLLLLLLLVPFFGLAQAPPYVVGKVLDDSTRQGIDNATVTNPRTKQVGRTNRLGAFYLLVKPGDSILVRSLTHGRAGLRWDGETAEPVIRMKRQFPDEIAIELPNVTIRGKREEEIRRELEQILSEPTARKGLSEDEILGLAQSPITLLYEAFSKVAKSRRKAAVLSQQYRRHKLADYRLELIANQATSLTGDELEAFKKFCNLSDEFILTASEYDLTYAVLHRFEAYRHVGR
jgi:hypothetical protein